jgi:hypothetical protein
MPLICPTPQGKHLRHFNATGKSLEVREILSSEAQLLELFFLKQRPGFARLARASRDSSPAKRSCAQAEAIGNRCTLLAIQVSGI